MSKSEALIGYSGFVGGNIGRQHQFDALYDVGNIEEVSGQHFDIVVCAGAPGVKWLANKEPEADMASIQRLMDALTTISTKQFVLISTIDVYGDVNGVTEDTPIIKEHLAPYGKHRRILEEFVTEKFTATIVRLPGVFGQGLKKNIIYDFMHQVRTPVHPKAIFQFYSLDNLWKDITVATENHVPIINIATEPLSMKELESQVFGRGFFPEATGQAPHYNMQTKHAKWWQVSGNYLYDKHQVVQELKTFIAS